MIRPGEPCARVSYGSYLEAVHQAGTTLKETNDRTLVTLFLHFHFLCKVLVLLPFDLGAQRTLINEVTGYVDIWLVDVRLFENLVFKELVLGEVERKLVAKSVLGFGEVRDSDISEMLECCLIAVGDELVNPEMVS